MDERWLFEPKSFFPGNLFPLIFWYLEMDNTVQELCSALMIRKLGNGLGTLVWYDTWIPTGLLYTHLTNALTTSTSLHIADIIRNGQWYLADNELLPVWHWILSQDIPDTHTRQEGSWQWKLTKSGKFSFASAWDNVYGQNFELTNMIWFHCSSPNTSVLFKSSLRKTTY